MANLGPSLGSRLLFHRAPNSEFLIRSIYPKPRRAGIRPTRLVWRSWGRVTVDATPAGVPNQSGLARELTITAGSCRPAGSSSGFGTWRGFRD